MDESGNSVVNDRTFVTISNSLIFEKSDGYTNNNVGIVIPNNVTELENSTGGSDGNPVAISLPNSCQKVTKVESGWFVYSLDLGDGLKEFDFSIGIYGYDMFIFPESLEKLTLANARTYRLYIPKNVSEIIDGLGLAVLTRYLISLKVSPENQFYKSQNNCLLTADGKTLLLAVKYTNVIPNGVEAIGKYALSNNKNLRLNVPEGVKTIGINVFVSSSFKEITLPSTITSVNSSAIYNSKNLTKLTINKLSADADITYESKLPTPSIEGKTFSHWTLNGVQIENGSAIMGSITRTNVYEAVFTE